MLRRLLNIASIVCLVLCVALMGMWVRSYYWMDEFGFTPLGAFLVGGGFGMRSNCDWHRNAEACSNLHTHRLPIGEAKSQQSTNDGQPLLASG